MTATDARRLPELLRARRRRAPRRRSPTRPPAWPRRPSRSATPSTRARSAPPSPDARRHQCRRRRPEGSRRLRRRHLPRRHAPGAGRAVRLRGAGRSRCCSNRDAPLALAIDPLDGSSNIDTNVSIGTIFSLLPATGAPDADPAASFLQPGRKQLGAGFFIYGPQLALVLTLGSGTHVFVLLGAARRLRAGP